MRRKIISPLLIVVFFVVFGCFTRVQAQTAVHDIIITQVFSDNYPEVSLRLRALDENGFPVGGLTLADLIVSEDGRVVTSLSNPQPVDGELWGYLINNAGIRMMQGNRLDQARSAMQNYVETPTWFAPGDRLALGSIEGREVITRLPFTLDGDGLDDSLSRYTPTPPCRDGVCSAPLEALDNFLDLNPWQDTGNAPRFMLIFTGAIDDVITGPSVAALAAKANALQIPVYTVIMDGSGADNVLVDLAQATGGGYLLYDNEESVNSLYRQIADTLRPQYEISYRADSGNAGVRQIKVAAVTHEENGAQASYTVEIAEPRVIIESPNATDRLVEGANDSPQTITARVTFPDDFQRKLVVATLLLNGRPVATLENPEAERFEFDLPWAEMAGLDDVTFAIEVIDELGLTSPPASVQPQVVIAAPPAEAVAPTLAPEATPSIPAEETASPSSGMGLFELIVTLLLVLVIIVAIVLVLIILKNKGTPPVQAVRETIMRGVERMTQRYSAQSEPKAYLIVQEGDTSVGKHLEIFGATTIGRDKQDAELLFQLNDANSPISRRHCTILDEEDHFQIRDEDSANGTYLNGVRLQPMIPRSLYDGDEIELARVERGGVKLQFQTVQPAAADQTMIGVKPNFDETHGTRVVKRPSPPDSGDSF